jgi:hypothetical protein
MQRTSFVILGAVVAAIGLLVGVYYAMIPCATNLVDAQRLGIPWCGYSRLSALAGLFVAAMGGAILALGGKAKQSATDGAEDSSPTPEG